MILQGKTALVTGAARRVGRAIARALARREANLLLHYGRSGSEARRLAAELSSLYGVKAQVLQADLAKPAQVRRLAREALRKAGTVHALVNNASIYERTPLERADERAWDAHMAVNARAPFLLAKALAPAMRRAGEGKVVNVADWAGLRPYAGYLPYCASKAALLCVSAALAKALAPEVQVNSILPGPVMPPEGWGAREKKAAAQANLLKRLGRPEDVAEAVLFLIEGSDFVTGAQLAVDGGRLIA